MEPRHSREMLVCAVDTQASRGQAKDDVTNALPSLNLLNHSSMLNCRRDFGLPSALKIQIFYSHFLKYISVRV
jgi:hypothetical protein